MRSKSLLVACYLVPLLFFLFMGGIFTSVMPDMKNTLTQSMIVMSVSMGAFTGFPPSLAETYGTDIQKVYLANRVPFCFGLATMSCRPFSTWPSPAQPSCCSLLCCSMQPLRPSSPPSFPRWPSISPCRWASGARWVWQSPIRPSWPWPHSLCSCHPSCSLGLCFRPACCRMSSGPPDTSFPPPGATS